MKVTVEGKKCKLKELHCQIIQATLLVAGIVLILFGVTMVFLAPNIINTKIHQVIIEITFQYLSQ